MEKQEPRGNENDAFETQKMQNNAAEHANVVNWPQRTRESEKD